MEISSFSTDHLSSHTALNSTYHNLISIKILFHLMTLEKLCNAFMDLFAPLYISHIVKYSVKKHNHQIRKFESRDLNDKLPGPTAQSTAGKGYSACHPNSVVTETSAVLHHTPSGWQKHWLKDSFMHQTVAQFKFFFSKATQICSLLKLQMQLKIAAGVDYQVYKNIYAHRWAENWLFTSFLRDRRGYEMKLSFIISF